MFLTTAGNLSKWGNVGIKAGGGFALFIIVLWWWNSGANPVKEIKKEVQEIKTTLEDVRKSLPDQIAAAVIKKLGEQQQTARPREATAPSLDFLAAFREVAKQFQTTPEEAERVVKEWVVENATTADLSKRAEAEFLGRNFTRSAELSDDAAADKLGRAEKLGVERAGLVAAAVEDITRAGRALYAASQFDEALGRFAKALAMVDPGQSSETWAGLQRWIGGCHRELGIQVAGDAMKDHLKMSVSAYRETLKVYTREQLQQDWAMTQNNLGAALCDQAGRSEGTEAVRLLSESVSAYNEALTVFTKDIFPSYNAVVLNNLKKAKLMLDTLQAKSQ